MYAIDEFVARLVLGEPKTFGGLTVFPLSDRAATEPRYEALSAAIAAGRASVMEVSEGGSVPELLIENSGDRPVLAIDGEELIGAKQNRVLNVSILVPARSKVKVPVSCTEAGRWRRVSEKFTSSPQTMYPSARARKTRDVSDSLMRLGSYRGDQGAVWDEISAKSERLGVRSGSSAMADIYTQRASAIDQYAEVLAPADGQVGALYAFGGKIVGLDCFDAASTWREYSSRLLRGYALDALEFAQRTDAVPTPAAATEWVRRLAEVPVQKFPAVGAGETLRLADAGTHGSALASEERVVHLVAFGE